MPYTQLIYEISDRILTITLNRPNHLNALNTQMINEIYAALGQAADDDNIRAIIFTGEGRAFCAGAELEDRERALDYGETPVEDWRDYGGINALRIFELNKPIIAAINGPAVGGGLTLTLPMDIRIASTDARMGFVFTRRGVILESCSGWFLTRAVGSAQALEWVCTGRVFSAQEALAGRLVSRVVPPEELMNTARAIALEIAQNTAPVSVALSRQLLWRMLAADHPMESHKVESKLLHWLGRQPDAAEGINSFLDKRPPNFPMSPNKDMPEFYPWWSERHFNDK